MTRSPLVAAFQQLALLLSAIVLLTAAATLGLRPAPQFAKREAFVRSIERGERRLSPQKMAREWRAEIAAQEHLLQQDRWIAGALGAVGVVALLAFRATRPAPTPDPLRP